MRGYRRRRRPDGARTQPTVWPVTAVHHAAVPVSSWFSPSPVWPRSGAGDGPPGLINTAAILHGRPGHVSLPGWRVAGVRGAAEVMGVLPRRRERVCLCVCVHTEVISSFEECRFCGPVCESGHSPDTR